MWTSTQPASMEVSKPSPPSIPALLLLPRQQCPNRSWVNYRDGARLRPPPPPCLGAHFQVTFSLLLELSAQTRANPAEWLCCSLLTKQLCRPAIGIVEKRRNALKVTSEVNRDVLY